VKRLCLSLIGFYRKCISPLFPKCCRYYPSCSEYAEICFKYDKIPSAFCSTFFRILRCNPLFSGGINYPAIRRDFANLSVFDKARKFEPTVWFVPDKCGKFYIVKAI